MGVNVKVKPSIKDAIKDITVFQPDLILISDSISANLPEDIRNLRILTYNFRPVIVGLSKSSDVGEKLAVFDAGADDFFEEPVQKEEFQARVNAHLRRLFESQTNIQTNLYNAKISYKTINRTIAADDKNWAVLLVSIDNFDEYRNVYGDLASEKMLQTYIAIISSALDEGDYLGQLGFDDFVIVTNSLKSEKIAQYLVHAFDLIAQKFYNKQDASQGYIIQSGNDVEEKPIPIVTTSIAIVSNEFKKYANIKEFMTDLLILHRTVRSRAGSNYLKDRPKISAEGSEVAREYNNRVLIIEEDEALSLLLESNFVIRNYKTMTISSLMKLSDETIKNYNPALIILDAGDKSGLKDLDFCRKNLKEDTLAKIILTTSMRNKQEILNAGADLYLPKPYDIINLMNWAEKLLNEFNS